LIDLGDGLIQHVNLAQMQAQEKAVVIADASAQRRVTLFRRGLDATVDQFDQVIRVSFALDQRLEKGAPAQRLKMNWVSASE
jgi:hypothetical protein